MPHVFGKGHGASIQHKRRGNWPLFGQLLTLYVHRPGHNTRRRRLLHTDLVRAQSGHQGPDRCARCPASSVRGTGHRSCTRCGVIGLCLGNHLISMCIAQGSMRRGGCCFKPTWYVHMVVPRTPAGVPDASHLLRGARGVDQHQSQGNWPLFWLVWAL